MVKGYTLYEPKDQESKGILLASKRMPPKEYFDVGSITTPVRKDFIKINNTPILPLKALGRLEKELEHHDGNTMFTFDLYTVRFTGRQGKAFSMAYALDENDCFGLCLQHGILVNEDDTIEPFTQQQLSLLERKGLLDMKGTLLPTDYAYLSGEAQVRANSLRNPQGEPFTQAIYFR